MIERDERMRWFRDARFGLFIHWGIYSIPASGEWVRYHNNIPESEYENIASEFNPVNFNPSAWAELAWNAGMRYVVFTTKHHDGFCMFDSHNNDFNITNTPYGKDITAELIEAFRARGIKIGLYHSLVDWRHPHFEPDFEHPLGKNKEKYPERNMAVYRKYLYEQVEQLLTCYGKIDLMFFDYTSKYKNATHWDAEKMLEMVYSLQPEIIVNDRLSFHKTPTFYGDYATPEVALPNKQVEINGRKYDWETCMTMNNSWGYSIEDNNFKDPAVIVRALTRCVSMNGNLLLNIGPDSTGRIPPESVSIFKELGKWMKAHSRTVHGCSASEFKPPPGCSYTENNDNLFLHMHNPAMGDIILPGLKGRVERIRQVSDGSEIPMITHWGFELLEEDELRIRPPKHLAGNMPAVLQIKLKKA